jgi:hypothetical protein
MTATENLILAQTFTISTRISALAQRHNRHNQLTKYEQKKGEIF